jgi:tRNA A37 threonylcarbamoyladenosine synthetase subunit TsaC/SUA5/YrdC
MNQTSAVFQMKLRMPNMKLIKSLLAASLTLAAASTFAAPQQAPETEDKVVVSTQEQPETQGQAATDATASEAPASAPTATN